MEKLERSHPDRFTSDAIRHIVSIRISLSSPMFGHDQERPLPSTGAQINPACIVAVHLVTREVLIAEFSNDRLDRDKVCDLIDKNKCYHNS